MIDGAQAEGGTEVLLLHLVRGNGIIFDVSI
jgi:hypothetical protein